MNTSYDPWAGQGRPPYIRRCRAVYHFFLALATGKRRNTGKRLQNRALMPIPPCVQSLCAQRNGRSSMFRRASPPTTSYCSTYANAVRQSQTRMRSSSRSDTEDAPSYHVPPSSRCPRTRLWHLELPPSVNTDGTTDIPSYTGKLLLIPALK